MFAGIREDIRAVFERDPAARSTFEVLTCYPGLHAIWLHRISHRLWNWRLRWLARFFSNLSRWLTGIEIHPGARIGRRLFIDHGLGVVIGETTEIGDDCTLYQGVTLGGTSWNPGKRHPSLEDNVVVGAGAKVLGPFTVGAGARIGSNAVVTKAVPPGMSMVGVPARPVAKTDARQPSEQTKAIARKLGFDAYGLTRGMPDPVAGAIGALLDHIHALDERIEQMGRIICEMNGRDEASMSVPRLETPDWCCEEETSKATAEPAE